jgi:hypothetical protein
MFTLDHSSIEQTLVGLVGIDRKIAIAKHCKAISDQILQSADRDVLLPQTNNLELHCIMLHYLAHIANINLAMEDGSVRTLSKIVR